MHIEVVSTTDTVSNRFYLAYIIFWNDLSNVPTKTDVGTAVNSNIVAGENPPRDSIYV